MLYLKRLRVRDGVRIRARSCVLAQTAPNSARTAQIVTATSVLSVLASVVLCSAEYLGKHADKDDADRRHTGADDTDVDFDVRPVDHVGLVPCRVIRGGEFHKRFEAKRRDDCYTKEVVRTVTFFQTLRKTYKVPTKNIIATLILLRQDSWRWKTSYSGSASIHTSNAMLMMAFDHARALMLTHFPAPGSAYCSQ
jgi:hypothetical protein